MNFIYHNRLAIFLSICLLMAIGLNSLLTLPISMYPNIQRTVVRVTVEFKQDTTQFADNIGSKLEHSLKALNNVTLVEGNYRNGRVRYLVHYGWDSNPESALKDVASAASFYQSRLAREMPPIKVDFFNPGTEVYLVVTSEKLSSVQLSKFIRSSLQPAIAETKGVSNTWVSEVETRQLVIKLLPLTMAELNINANDVYEKLKQHEFNQSLGMMTSDHNGKIKVSLSRRPRQLEALSGIVIAQHHDQLITLADIANIGYESTDSARLLQLDNKTAIAIAAWPEPQANLYQVANDIISATREHVADQGEIIVLNNPARFIKEAIVNVVKAILIGIGIAGIVVVVFYRSFSVALLICLSMPISLLGGGIFMELAGVGINLLSLAAMSISVGLVVDGSIVVMDSVKEQLRKGNSPLNAVKTGMKHVAGSIITSQLTTVIVFVPLIFTLPVVSSLLKDIALVICAILIFSILICLVFIPTVMLLFPRFFLKTSRMATVSGPNKLAVWVAKAVSHTVTRVLLVVMVVCCGFLTMTFGSKIDQELMADPMPAIIDVNVAFTSDGLPNEQKLVLVQPLVNEINRLVKAKVRFSYTDLRRNEAYISIHLNSYTDFDSVFATLTKHLRSTDEYDIELSPWITSALPTANLPAARLFVSADNENDRRQYLDYIANWLKQLHEVQKVKTSPKNSKTLTYELDVNKRTLMELFPGEPLEAMTQRIEGYISMMIEDKYVGELELDNQVSRLYMRVNPLLYTTIEQFNNTPFSSDEQIFALRGVLTTREVKDWKYFYSRNSLDTYMIEVFLNKQAKLDLATTFDRLNVDIQRHFKLAYSPFVIGDPMAETRQGLTSLQNAFIFSAALVMLVLLFQTRNVGQTVIICCSIPLAIFGAIVSLYYFNSTVSLNSLLAMIMLSGLAVNNAIIFCAAYVRHYQQERNNIKALSYAYQSRFKSIMVTTLTSIAGMLPIAIGLGSSGKILQPLGIAMTTGLAISTVLSLLVVPALLGMINPLSSPIEATDTVDVTN
jgi:multidrug efflux pump subunit AcrB